tara:strand:+ start:280 stop:747 length:468 start_codon:yes stop_codon:yes gene_type:complete
MIGFGQDDINLNIDKKVEFTEKNDVKKGMGLSYQGSGLYTIGKEANRPVNALMPLTRFNKVQNTLKNKILEEIIEFTTNNNYNYEVTLVEKFAQNELPKVIVTFKIFNKDGSLVLNKDDAKKQLIELKEYLDLGIISEEEFNKKAVSLKKILLGK